MAIVWQVFGRSSIQLIDLFTERLSLAGCLKGCFNQKKSCGTFLLLFLSFRILYSLYLPTFTILMSAAHSTFIIPELARPCPAASRTPTRSPTSSFSKAPRPTGFSVDPSRLSLSSRSSHSSAGSIPPPPYQNDVDIESVIPGYGEEQEVQTMARSLFLFGFRESRFSSFVFLFETTSDAIRPPAICHTFSFSSFLDSRLPHPCHSSNT